MGIVVVITRSGNLVGANDADIVGKQILVETGDGWRRCAIDKDGIEDVHAQDGFAQNGRRTLVGRSLELSLPIVEVDALAIEDTLARVGQTYDAKLQVLVLLQVCLLVANLVDQIATNDTHASKEDIEN